MGYLDQVKQEIERENVQWIFSFGIDKIHDI